MSDEYGRPERLAGDLKLIRQLIAENEAKAALMSDEELEAARDEAQLKSLGLFPAIAEAMTRYQTPSQAFYVFDRVLNHRTLKRLHGVG